MSGNMLKNLKNIEEWEKIYNNENILVVYFTATWCGPCKKIYPCVENLVSKYNAISFVKVDVDKNEELVTSMGISCMPTFLFFKNKEIKFRLEGVNENKLIELTDLLNNSIFANAKEQIKNSSEDFSNFKDFSSDEDVI